MDCTVVKRDHLLLSRVHQKGVKEATVRTPLLEPLTAEKTRLLPRVHMEAQRVTVVPVVTTAENPVPGELQRSVMTAMVHAIEVGVSHQEHLQKVDMMYDLQRATEAENRHGTREVTTLVSLVLQKEAEMLERHLQKEIGVGHYQHLQGLYTMIVVLGGLHKERVQKEVVTKNQVIQVEE